MGQRIPGQEQGGEPAAEGGGAQGLTTLIQNVSQGLAMLAEVITDSGVDPALSDRIQSVQAEMDSIIETMSGGGGQGAQGAQPAAVEAGAGGVPQSPATR